jgi:hypothetical protein
VCGDGRKARAEGSSHALGTGLRELFLVAEVGEVGMSRLGVGGIGLGSLCHVRRAVLRWVLAAEVHAARVGWVGCG